MLMMIIEREKIGEKTEEKGQMVGSYCFQVVAGPLRGR